MNHRKFTAALILTCACCLVQRDAMPDFPETISCPEADRYKIQNILNRAASEKWSRFTVADIAVKTGLELAGTPYKGHTHATTAGITGHGRPMTESSSTCR